MGHGPSLLGRREGSRIDSFGVVVRQKRCQETLKHPDRYGTRVDAVCGSWTIASELPAVGAGEIWVFLDSRHSGVTKREVDLMQERLPCKIDADLCDFWNRLYRVKRTPYERPAGTREFDALGHPHLSAGFHTILYACQFLKPETITLAGFDNVESGGFTWSITRGPKWDKYPDHRFDIEHEMLKDVSGEFGVKIEFM